MVPSGDRALLLLRKDGMEEKRPPRAWSPKRWRGRALIGLAAAALLISALPLHRWWERREQLRSLADGRLDPAARLALVQSLSASALSEASNGSSGERSDYAILLLLAQDRSPKVRQAVARSLGELRSASALDVLGDLLLDGVAEVQLEAARNLTRFPAERYRPHFVSAYQTKEGATRRLIAAALGPRGVPDAIRLESATLWTKNLKAFESGGLSERIGAAEDLGRSGRGEATERLLLALESDHSLLAAAAARGFARSKDLRAVGPLSEALSARSLELRESAAVALGELGDLSAIAPLVEMARDGGSGAPTAVRALEKLMARPGGEAAKSALCQLTVEAAAPELARKLGLSLRARGGCPTERLVSRLTGKPEQLAASLAALEGLGRRGGAKQLLAFVESGPYEVKLAAVRLLREVTLPEAMPLLSRLMLESEARLNAQAGEALPAPREGALAFLAFEEEAKGEPESELDAHVVLSQEVEWMVALVEAAWRQGVEGSEQRAVALSFDVREPVRGAGCRLLMERPHDWPELAERCLVARAPSVLRAALEGAERGGGSALEPLARALPFTGPEMGRVALLMAGIFEAADETERSERQVAPTCEAGARRGGISPGEWPDAEQLVELFTSMLPVAPLSARAGLIEALGRVGARAIGHVRMAAATPLRYELFGERPELRAASAKALGLLGDEASADGLEALRFDYDVEVRRAAAEGLGRLQRGAPVEQLAEP